MPVLLGLGNPGARYERTRHNFGFLVVDCLVERLKAKQIRFRSSKFKAEVFSSSVDGKPTILIKPKTYVNLTGSLFSAPTPSELAGLFEPSTFVSPEDLIVVYDDVALPFGNIRLRSQGSDGGHNGIKSILEHYKGGFVRLRCGIANSDQKTPMVSFVLEPFSHEEQNVLGEVVNKITSCALHLVRDGFEAAANRFNNKGLFSI